MKIRYIYKFMEDEHAQSLVKKGSLRVGTLFDFKDTISYAHGVGDIAEGTLTSHMGGHTIVGNDPSTHPPQMARILKNKSLIINGSVRILNDFHEESQDHYVYSMSLAKKKEIANSLGRRYDACILIRNPVEFIAELTAYMNKHSFNVGDPQIKEITYHNRYAVHYLQTGEQPAFVKDPKYAVQQEIRAIWQSANSELIPKVITCPALKKFVEIVDY